MTELSMSTEVHLKNTIITISDIVERACEESSLVNALSVASTFDTERAVAEATRNNFQRWDTFSKYLFTQVIEQFTKKHFSWYQHKDIIVDQESKITYHVVGTPDKCKDFVTGLPVYLISRSSDNLEDDIKIVPQLIIETGRFRKLPTF
jgi:hypothetical protein